MSDPSQPQSWLARLRANRFVRAVAVLAGGTAAAQLIGIALMPVLTRLYAPEDFGVLAAFTATAAILAAAATLRYESAVPLPESEEVAARLVSLCLGLLAVTTVVVALAAVVVRPLLGDLGLAVLAPYWWAVPVGYFVVGLFNVATAWAIRRRSYRVMAQSRLGQAVVQGGGQVGLGLGVASPLGLVVGTIAGFFVGALMMARRGAGGRWWPQLRWDGLGEVASRYRRFPLYMLGSQWLTAAGAQAPALLIVALFGPAIGGLFLLSQKLLGLPVNVISRAVGQTYLGEGAELARRNPAGLRRLCSKTVVRLAAIGLVPAVVFMLLAEPAFVLAFGEAWRESACYVQLLAIPYLLKFAASPLSHGFVLIERQDLALLWSAFRFLTMLVALVGAWVLELGAATAVGALGAAMVLSYAVQFVMFDMAARRLTRPTD